MAHKITYQCTHCGYKAEVFEGRGFMGQHIVEVTCGDCKTIQPLVVGGVIGDSAPSFRSIVGRLCLNCGSDKISVWDGKTCPKCGHNMQPTGHTEFWT
jgi:DNA-directed RNA polymerase subunit RPC12/RpoP